ncbi:MAG: putative FMN-binding protein [Deltaproteobacteria bacterium]|nr:putative FMN-binding protein [Deltaproteobacteria bacterium]
MNKRDAIQLSEDERKGYLTAALTIILVTVGRDGYPHAVPMWFLMDDDGSVYMTTYGRSQKVVNIRRNPRVALLVESGVRYDELKGVLLRGKAEILDDEALCIRVLTRIHRKHMGALVTGVEEVMRAQARKRIVVKVTPERLVSWDHRKLSGVY